MQTILQKIRNQLIPISLTYSAARNGRRSARRQRRKPPLNRPGLLDGQSQTYWPLGPPSDCSAWKPWRPDHPCQLSWRHRQMEGPLHSYIMLVVKICCLIVAIITINHTNRTTLTLTPHIQQITL